MNKIMASFLALLLVLMPSAAFADHKESHRADSGNSQSDPDDNGKGPDRSNGGPDKPDGNNGSGNDADCEDDNEGKGGPKCKPKHTPAPKESPKAVKPVAPVKVDKPKKEKPAVVVDKPKTVVTPPAIIRQEAKAPVAPFGPIVPRVRELSTYAPVVSDGATVTIKPSSEASELPYTGGSTALLFYLALVLVGLGVLIYNLPTAFGRKL